MDWTWLRAHRCATTSPALSVTGIPPETKMLQVTLVDQDVPGYRHGGGAVEHDGSGAAAIPAGALKDYRGPCPPDFASFGHEYIFTVKAIGADGKSVLAQVSKTKTFSASAVKE